ncbi:MAG: phosphate acyltransferase PlsX [Clostridia bacterium]
MKIAVDAMGGDFAPMEIVAGAYAAAQKQKDIFIILVGDKIKIEEQLQNKPQLANLNIFHASQVIEMHEEAALAYKQKKDSSIAVASRLVAEHKADAVVSAGSTGAQLVAGIFEIGRMKGVKRPAIITYLPTIKDDCLVIDVGANADCKAEYLQQFAILGSAYAASVLGKENPAVALLNIGSEEEKGNELYKETHKLLKKAPINFVGNIEGRQLLAGDVDVIVCDGFTGNVLLKTAEGVAMGILSILKTELMSSALTKMGAMLAAPAFRKVKKKMDYKERGGAPLLGINGISIICHGSSNSQAIENAIYLAEKCVRTKMIEKTIASLGKEA